MISDIYKNLITNNKINNSIYVSDLYIESNNTYIKKRKNSYDLINRDNNKIILSNYFQEIVVYSYLYNHIKYHKLQYHAFPDLISISMNNIILSKYHKLDHVKYNNMDIVEFKNFIFQIYMACMTFNKIKLTHIDLHTDNIVYETIDGINNNFKLDYEIIDTKYNNYNFSIYTNTKYKIIDYEWSCINDIENNIIIVPEFIIDDDFNISNEFKSSYDFLTFLFDLSKNIIYQVNNLLLRNKYIDFISSILKQYYRIDINDMIQCKIYLSDDVINIPLESLIEFFKSEIKFLY